MRLRQFTFMTSQWGFTVWAETLADALALLGRLATEHGLDMTVDARYMNTDIIRVNVPNYPSEDGDTA